MNILSNILMFVFVLVGIAYLTMLERKILRYIQFPKDPNKVGLIRLIQPFRDGFKFLDLRFEKGIWGFNF